MSGNSSTIIALIVTTMSALTSSSRMVLGTTGDPSASTGPKTLWSPTPASMALLYDDSSFSMECTWVFCVFFVCIGKGGWEVSRWEGMPFTLHPRYGAGHHRMEHCLMRYKMVMLLMIGVEKCSYFV